MYKTLENIEVVPLSGRPRREDEISRVNYKLNTNVRKLLKARAIRNGRSESSQVEQNVLEAEALIETLQENPEIAASFLPKFNEKLEDIIDRVGKASTEND